MHTPVKESRILAGCEAARGEEPAKALRKPVRRLRSLVGRGSTTKKPEFHSGLFATHYREQIKIVPTPIRYQKRCPLHVTSCGDTAGRDYILHEPAFFDARELRARLLLGPALRLALFRTRRRRRLEQAQQGFFKLQRLKGDAFGFDRIQINHKSIGPSISDGLDCMGIWDY